MKIVLSVLVLMVKTSLVFSYSDESFDEQRVIPFRPHYQDERVSDAGPQPGDSNLYPYGDILQFLQKRSYPRWYHAFVYKNPKFHPTPLTQSKRFLPFHPLARFRGLSMVGAGGPGAGSGGVIGGGSSSYHDNFEPFIPETGYIPSPGHPVPSGDTKPTDMESDTAGSGHDNAFMDSQDYQHESSKERMNAGDILRYLGAVPSDRDNGRESNKIFRFGMQ